MLRNRYNLNGSFEQKYESPLLRPTFFYECVPGETWQGTIDTHIVSAATKAYPLNKVYLDHYVF